MEHCPKCKGKNVETQQDSVDIGVGIQYGPLYWHCHDCGADNDNYCPSHHRDFEKIQDRQERFEEEKADLFGCPSCYVTGLMES